MHVEYFSAGALLGCGQLARVNGRGTMRVFAEPQAEGFYRMPGYADRRDLLRQPLSPEAIPLARRVAAGS